MLKGISINCFDVEIDGHLDRLAPHLERACANAFDGYEFSSEAVNLIRAGRVIQPEVDRLKDILARYNLRYTVHPPCELRLTDRSGMGRHDADGGRQLDR